MRLFGTSMALDDFPTRLDLVGLDMSGAAVYANRLPTKLGYTNTFLHKQPYLDITSPNDTWSQKCDFVISSDVLEHVAPPVSVAFENVYKLLKPGGVFILTVPYRKEGATIEHFPNLHEYSLREEHGRRILLNRTKDGDLERFEQLVFHGGEGETLEMRVFSEQSLLEELRAAGFHDIRIHKEDVPTFGILWPHDWSLPISAARPCDSSSEHRSSAL